MFRSLVHIVLRCALVFGASAATAQPVLTIVGGGGTVDLGQTALGSSSAVALVTVQNTGTATLTISSVSSTGDFSNPSTPIACQAVVNVAAGGTCTVFVQFTPTALDTRNGVVSIVSNAAGSPHTFNVTGFGIIAAAYNASPLSLTFGNQAVGTTSPAQIVTLSNPGTVTALATSGFAITGDFAQTNNCGASIPPLSSCQFNVTFTPTVAGLRTGTLSFCPDCNFVTTEVNLQGNSGAPASGQPIPALDQWALAGLFGLLALAAMYRLRRAGRQKR